MWKKSSAFYKPGPVFLDDRKVIHKLFSAIIVHNLKVRKTINTQENCPPPSPPPQKKTNKQNKTKQKYNGPPFKSSPGKFRSKRPD